MRHNGVPGIFFWSLECSSHSREFAFGAPPGFAGGSFVLGQSRAGQRGTASCLESPRPFDNGALPKIMWSLTFLCFVSRRPHYRKHIIWILPPCCSLPHTCLVSSFAGTNYPRRLLGPGGLGEGYLRSKYFCVCVSVCFC